jgi:hypothetical protein
MPDDPEFDCGEAEPNGEEEDLDFKESVPDKADRPPQESLEENDD